ncbi:MAG: YceI family protein [Deltaproteobacteria bacterium]|nr:YceI family protein [Deltaproteobacteria bacterium]
MNSKYNQNVVAGSDLKTLLTEKPETVLIDLLPPDHFTGRHIPGAKNACVFQVSFLDDVAAIVPDKQVSIVVYGASQNSQDAATALEKLDRAGYAHLTFLKGGLEEWSRAGYDFEGEAPDQQDDPQTTVTLPDGQYTVDAGASEVEWTGRNPNTSHFGTVDIAKGVIDINDRQITGMVEIDMNTIHNINLEGDELHPVLEAHLRSDDFFFTKMFPKAVFTVKEATRIDRGWQTAPNYHVNGELTLRGVSADLDFDATVAVMDDGSLAMEAHFDMDRTRWNVIYGSTRFFEHLGMHKVFDLISFQIQMIAAK